MLYTFDSSNAFQARSTYSTEEEWLQKVWGMSGLLLCLMTWEPTHRYILCSIQWLTVKRAPAAARCAKMIGLSSEQSGWDSLNDPECSGSHIPLDLVKYLVCFNMRAVFIVPHNQSYRAVTCTQSKQYLPSSWGRQLSRIYASFNSGNNVPG